MQTPRGTLVHAERDADGLLEVIDDATTRSLYFGNSIRQSSMNLHSPHSLALGYTRHMLAALLFVPDPRRVLMIGLGGGSLARFLHHHFPLCRIDAIERRAAVIDLARRFFALPDDGRLQIRHGDGFARLGEAPEGPGYDLLLIDAFDAEGMAPALAESEVFAQAARQLRNPGALAVNLWSSSRPEFRHCLAAIERGFGGPVLRLPVGQRANVVSLGIKTRRRPALKALRQPARELRRRTGLDLPAYLRQLQRHNGLLARLFR
ncbi:hypothetical protein QVG61_02700 [Thiohalobacter sp. IOR34]|uniref:spermine/spermidine synthase domain-containing protein n=1 Tax=Thiohalobacter sp. IOR34 TaxID=3057176 RepID=UPI0025B11D16|nr:hypothetical protein [Thiohalobacter sp. IOR34]WJW76019.1 hypothetical protein QVG61_02700 [Thiohalobacter sp. IOR34]